MITPKNPLYLCDFAEIPLILYDFGDIAEIYLSSIRFRLKSWHKISYELSINCPRFLVMISEISTIFVLISSKNVRVFWEWATTIIWKLIKSTVNYIGMRTTVRKSSRI